VAEYALRDNARPLGIAEYQLAQSLPEPLQTNLPTIEQIERELASGVVAWPWPEGRGRGPDRVIWHLDLQGP
jgi:hypothetical protein